MNQSEKSFKNEIANIMVDLYVDTLKNMGYGKDWKCLLCGEEYTFEYEEIKYECGCGRTLCLNHQDMNEHLCFVCKGPYQCVFCEDLMLKENLKLNNKISKAKLCKSCRC